MMVDALGFLAALISVLGWGSHLVPMKKLQNYDTFYYQALMATGILLSSLAVVLVAGEFRLSLLGLLCGFLWKIGNAISLVAVKKDGISMAVPVWTSTSILSSFLWGLFFFKENLSNLLFAVLGISLLIVGANVVSLTGSNREKNRTGVLLALPAGVFFGSYLVPMKISGLEPNQFLFSMALGIFVTGWGFFLAKGAKLNRSAVVSGLSSGVLWNVANFSSLYAVALLGLSIGLPFMQNSLLVAVLWGLFYFKEVNERRGKAQVMVGALVMIVGTFLLGFSK
ncbi:MAG: GRP family sugar transporter [Thaumarchaeota archaeon]|nr:GRP family sugar transporter [Nitrososphaerota archaeon]MCL5317972.1 GRP family sugar transporter [Nitrososphaerota archaeon]